MTRNLDRARRPACESETFDAKSPVRNAARAESNGAPHSELVVACEKRETPLDGVRVCDAEVRAHAR